MFLTGFLFGSFVVFKICTVESLLPTAGNAGVSLGAGMLFGLITMLVQHAGLFLTGFHTGLFAGFGAIALLRVWYTPATVWITVGVLLACSIVGAVLNLFWQKGGGAPSRQIFKYCPPVSTWTSIVPAYGRVSLLCDAR